MKTFSTSGTGSQQTLSEIESDKIPIYNSVADAEADLTNLKEGQIIATKDEGNETSTPVDVVEDGNMHAVTSNAVYDVVQEIKHDATYVPHPYSGISWIIPSDFVQSISQIDGVAVEGKTVEVAFKVYEGEITFSVQLSYGTTDAMIQQMSGEGRVRFVTIDQTDTNYTIDGVWKVYTRNVSVPQGSPIFGIGSKTAKIGIVSLRIIG